MLSFGPDGQEFKRWKIFRKQPCWFSMISTSWIYIFALACGWAREQHLWKTGILEATMFFNSIQICEWPQCRGFTWILILLSHTRKQWYLLPYLAMKTYSFITCTLGLWANKTIGEKFPGPEIHQKKKKSPKIKKKNRRIMQYPPLFSLTP